MEAYTSISLTGKHLPFSVEIQAMATMQAHIPSMFALPCFPNISQTQSHSSFLVLIKILSRTSKLPSSPPRYLLADNTSSGFAVARFNLQRTGNCLPHFWLAFFNIKHGNIYKWHLNTPFFP